MKKTLSIITIILYSSLTFADNTAPDYSSLYTGNWNGNRTKLHNKGIDISANYTVHYLNNLKSGIKKRQGTIQFGEVKFDFDGAKMANLNGTNALIDFVYFAGSQPNEKWVGSIQGVDALEETNFISKLNQAWISQNFYNDKLNLLVGLYSTINEFYLVDSAQIFLSSNIATGAEYNSTYLNPEENKTYGLPSTPLTSLGTRIKFNPNDLFYIQSALSSSVIQNGSDMKNNYWKIDSSQSYYAILEAGITTAYGNYSLGTWQSGKKYLDLINQEVLRRNSGYYLTAEKSLYKNDFQELTAFIRYGNAYKKVSLIDHSWSSGLVLNGVFETRKNSQLAFGISQAHLGGYYRSSVSQNNQVTRTRETTLELTYSDTLFNFLQIQPDIQYIIHPTNEPVNNSGYYLKNDLVFILSMNVNF